MDSQRFVTSLLPARNLLGKAKITRDYKQAFEAVIAAFEAFRDKIVDERMDDGARNTIREVENRVEWLKQFHQ